MQLGKYYQNVIPRYAYLKKLFTFGFTFKLTYFIKRIINDLSITIT